MKESEFHKELEKCVRCGACKSLCPTYLSALDETMGARGRVTMLGALVEKRLKPTNELSQRIFSCIQCEACKDLCPTGIDIPEAIYHGRMYLRNFYTKDRILRKTIKFSLERMDSLFSVFKGLYKTAYPFLYRTGKLRYIPHMASTPFKNSIQVYKQERKKGRVALFVGCSVNYLYPHLGTALLQVLIARGYEVVVLKGEVCCGAPMRAMGLEDEAVLLAQKNIEIFNKMRAEAILSICPTCTLTIRKQYPLLTGGTIEKIMDINEFFIRHDIINDLQTEKRVVTYHDPCHLRYGLNIYREPRELLGNIKGIEFVEMQNAEECCGFGGFFSLNFKSLSKDIGKKKMSNITNTNADTVVTSCPGCMMQLEDLRRDADTDIQIIHMVELIAEAMQGKSVDSSHLTVNRI
jgi:glycolate oxidase iron-sulfur subunit